MPPADSMPRASVLSTPISVWLEVLSSPQDLAALDSLIADFNTPMS
jgi:hypothetical protein